MLGKAQEKILTNAGLGGEREKFMRENCNQIATFLNIVSYLARISAQRHFEWQRLYFNF
jgi:hypothetical protein